MTEIIIYSTPVCPYCDRAKALFDKLGLPYQVIDVSTDTNLRQAMTEKAGGRTSVPQIFIDGQHIGGFDDLNALYKSGDLKKLLENKGL